MDEIDVFQEAYAVRGALEAALNDMTARKVELTREEAISALGMINALISAMTGASLQ